MAAGSALGLQARERAGKEGGHVHSPRNISAHRKTRSNSARCACARLGSAPGVPMTCLPGSPKRPKRMPGGSEIASSVLPASSAAWTAWAAGEPGRTHARTHAARQHVV